MKCNVDTIGTAGEMRFSSIMKIGRFGTILVFVTSYVRLWDASRKLVEHFSDIEFLQSSHLEITVFSVRMK